MTDHAVAVRPVREDRGRRVLRVPLAVHVALLAVVLTAGVLLTSPGVPFFSDEGAAIIQARLLERAHSWVEPNPLPQVDPLGAARTIPNADVGTKGRAPYGRHPLYPWVLEVADRLFGPAGFVALSVAGAVLAALGAALLARRLDARLAVPVLWLTGVGSPLVFDSGIVIAHTVAAALAAFAALCLLRALTASAWPARGWAFGVAGLVALTAALRTEGAIFGIALALAAAVAWLARWPGVDRRGAALSGAASLAAVIGVHEWEKALAIRHYGRPVPSLSGGETSPARSFVAARVHAFLQTWLTPGYHPTLLAQLALLSALLAVAGAAILARAGRRPDLMRFLLGLAVAAVVLRTVAGPPEAIPGLMIVFPAGWFALLAARRADFPTTAGRVLVTVVVLFAVGVLTTSYPKGGGVEWGGRYFALGLPLAAPLVVLVVVNRARFLDPAAGSAILAALTVLAGLFAVMGWIALDHGHAVTRRVLAAIDRQAAPLGARPVIVTPERFVPQIDWPHYFDYRWLVPQRQDLGADTGRLAQTGVERILLVTADPVHDLPSIASYRSTDSVQVRPVTIAAMARVR